MKLENSKISYIYNVIYGLGYILACDEAANILINKNMVLDGIELDNISWEIRKDNIFDEILKIKNTDFILFSADELKYVRDVLSSVFPVKYANETRLSMKNAVNIIMSEIRKGII